MSRSLHLIGYDIGDDKNQSAVRKQIKNYAITGQKSAYECWITHRDRQDLVDFIHDMIDKGDSFLIIRIKRTYWQNLPKHYSLYIPSENHVYIG